MAATYKLDHSAKSRNSSNLHFNQLVMPRHGVLTLYGYGVKISMEQGHLAIEDGLGIERRQARLPRVGHGLRRLVVIGADGMVSLAALRWLADQDAAFVMLDRDGSVLITTGPVRPSDAKLRRAQALAHSSEAALRIARKLISSKVAGQQQVAKEKLLDSTTAQVIGKFHSELATAETIAAVRLIESQAAAAYWAAWRGLPITFPKNDLSRVPDHWRAFDTRKSPLSGSQRLAANPVNAILNYLYALLESESRLAAAALGLDPGLGFIHVDTSARDSFACDLMEPVRPQVDAFVLDWITRESLRREWFFEQRDGNCRLMGEFTARLSETSQTWARAVAPYAEYVAHTLLSSGTRPASQPLPPTRLTQRHRREAKGASSLPPIQSAPRPQTICRTCGTPISMGDKHCGQCAVAVWRKGLIAAARVGRVAAQSAEAQARRSETKRRHDAARLAWRPSDNPDWLNGETYSNKIEPRLAGITVPAISSALGVSEPYAADIRTGRRRPHPRHWLKLAQIVNVSEEWN